MKKKLISRNSLEIELEIANKQIIGCHEHVSF